MTCFEKYKLEHDGENPDVKRQCPHISGGIGIAEPTYCNSGRSNECSPCWEREIPDTDSTPVIKDSGERREFPTGAVRDIQEGKGRCDLMPLEVVAKILNGDSLYNPDLVVGRIAHFKNSGYEETTHLYGALFHLAERNPLLGDMTASFADMFLEVSKHFEEGAKKYGENNWQKGLPINCYIDSAVRHYLKWLRGDNDEPHYRAFIWNLMCCIWTCDFKPELNNNEEETK